MTKRIAIIGPESTGKSELCQHLARIYNTEWVPEFARFYLDRLDRDYEQHDLVEIAKGQMVWEDDKAEDANEYLFCDTNLIVMKVWSDHKYGVTDQWIIDELKRRTYDYYLLANIDLIWRPDPQREHPKLRKHFFDIYEGYLKKHNLPYGLVSGIEDKRVACAKDLLDSFFSA
ncbi:AAA family ATPase [Marinoscillum furvescens]|uniref:NadR type nicotinamide-nucleotide adenylyltransferase n=1 Tax=Marinoscillum furvescens DSM 4134 TaxID=1122208 RepID=A0A3D9L7X4_MARFU|nr:ATP-binding protein [Marinoscillum furvescens]REE01613.1 NadR type nicotinamide-nucleotide adenylyltransferase [Marinoscillum furvescens DSM 4134]